MKKDIAQIHHHLRQGILSGQLYCPTAKQELSAILLLSTIVLVVERYGVTMIYVEHDGYGSDFMSQNSF